MQKINTKIDPAFLAECMNMKKLVGNDKFSICMDLEHIANCQYELIMDRSRTFYTINFKGGHLAGTLRKLEKEGVVSIKSLIEFGGGCIEYQAEDIFSGQLFKHTEYPHHWNPQKIADEVKSVIKIAITDQTDLSKGQTFLKRISGDFYLKIVADPNPKNHICQKFQKLSELHIITAHPFKK